MKPKYSATSTVLIINPFPNIRINTKPTQSEISANK